jgi:hemoglobin-like flavoprotein
MTPDQIRMVQSTWREIAPMSADAAKLFYGKLFEVDPRLRPLFRSNLEEQGRKLMAMITTAVNALEQVESLVPAVQDLGRRHASYGVQERDYETVGIALLWTLEKGLGSGFTPEVKLAWTDAYATLATVMKSAARLAA